MPSFRKLTPAEVAALERPQPSQRKRIAEEYDRMLAGFTAAMAQTIDVWLE